MVVVLLIFIITVLISSCCYTGSNIDSVGYINKNLGFEIQNAYYYYDSMHVGKEFMAIYDRDTGELYYYEGTSWWTDRKVMFTDNVKWIKKV